MSAGLQGARQIAEAIIENGKRLDGIARIMANILTALQQGGPGGGGSLQVHGVTKPLLEILVAAGLHPAPRQTMPVTVPITQVLLVENQSEPMLIVQITNDDPVKEIWVGEDGVSRANGSVIMPQASEWYVLAPNQKMFGVCALTTVSARVSIGSDMMTAVRGAFG